MPVTSNNIPRFNNAGGVTAGGGGNSRTGEASHVQPSTPTFLERHGHTPMNLDVQVLATQNGTRGRTESSPAPPSTTSAAATPAAAPSSSSVGTNGKITIRIVPAMDSFTRLPLRFDPIDRKVNDGEVLVVGRHTDRLVTEHPTAVVFRSKVVSRSHAKMWSTSGQWYLQDVGSSSGTFLNHIRLSPPNVESTPYAIKDGDIVQLGIDFRVHFLHP
jgi:pSer/pThr/pTyr-binding forkhead associated (FHA) protein